ncbi:MAG: 50S ribosomal protein L10 [Thermaerobacter sp.]|nr:50S ribosomal protein L10 [Thermaerobacter sp.]MDA8144585.1 50S ribosomal protein L10 [Thermaerobacter sp.]
MPTPEKERTVAEVAAKLAAAQGVVLTRFAGLSVGATTALRRKLRESGVEYRVVKNTLIRLAARQVGVEGLEEFLEGPTALAFSAQDAVLPAKLLVEFIREHRELEVKAGILEGRVVGPDAVRELAGLPERPVLLARVAGALNAPIANFASVLQAPLRQAVFVLAAVRDAREAAG